MMNRTALQKPEGILSRAYLASVLALYAIRFLNTSMFYQVTKTTGYAIVTLVAIHLVFILALFSAIRQFLNAGGEAGAAPALWKRLGLLLLKIAMVFAGFFFFFTQSKSYDIWILMVIALTLDGIREERVFRPMLQIGVAIVIAMYVLSLLGIVQNNRGNAFGFIYRTHYACHLLCLTLLYCLLKGGRLTWQGELALPVLACLVIVFVEAKTCFICLLLLAFGTYWRHYRRLGAIPWQDRQRYGAAVRIIFSILYLPVVGVDRLFGLLRLKRCKGCFARLAIFSYIICAGLFIALTASYRTLLPILNRLPRFFLFSGRLQFGSTAFEEFPLKLFGSFIPQWGNSGSEGGVDLNFSLDSAYVKILLEYGIVPFTLSIGLMTWAQVRLYRRGRYYAMFVLAIFAIDCMVEYWMISLGYNAFILIVSCALRDGEAPAEIQAEPGAFRPHRRRNAALAAVCGLIIVAWSVTAYAISAWRGWTPTSGATLVVPGSYVDGVGTSDLLARRIAQAGSYLYEHEDADCILSGSAQEVAIMREILTESGIDGGRLRLDEGTDNIDGMLANARERIGEEGLAPRLTVCACAMQQARIARHARAMNIPLNSLTSEMPWRLYLPNYLIEQWRVFQ